jgi:SAM-dependent methyltransferase
VLDVAAGTGNVAIRAALAGASVVAADLTPELFAAGRRGADAVGVHVEWIEGDAESLPFDDESFDVVTSCLGAMFAPDHRAVAGELLRVCRPGGTIGLISFTPDGRGGEFFALLAPYVPESPPGADSPVSWGSEPHVEALLGSGASQLIMRRQTYVERARSPAAYCRLFSETFGPLMAIRDGLAGTPDRQAEFDRAFLDAVTRWSGATTGPVQIGYEYLLTIARRASA